MSECVFCRIARGDIPAKVIYKDDKFTAFEDINPQAPVHVLVIPNTHIETLDSVSDFGIYEAAFEVISQVVKIKNLTDNGYRVVANCKRDGGQEVYHIHFHVLGGRPMKWPPG